MPSCNCCQTLLSSAGWKDLISLIENIVGLPPALDEMAESSVLINGDSSQPTRKRTPAARRGLPEELDPLTRREIDILQLVGRGMSVREMAGELKLAESTIGNHKYRLMRKLDVSSSLGLLRIAVRTGLSEL